MIIVKKPFIYLRDVYNWRYKKGVQGFLFMCPDKIMVLIKRKRKKLVIKDNETLQTSEDAKYETITIRDFSIKVRYYKDDNQTSLVFNGYSWGLEYVKLGLKIVKNAVICIPLKLSFPLIIQNEEYKFYIAPISIEDIEFKTLQFETEEYLFQ